MKKALKSDVIKLLEDLKEKGLSREELAVAIGKSSQTIYDWGQADKPRVPGKSDYEVLKRLLK